jgi:hypothetical protein
MSDFTTITATKSKRLKELVLDIESLELFQCALNLDSDQVIQLREAKEELFNLIKYL